MQKREVLYIIAVALMAATTTFSGSSTARADVSFGTPASIISFPGGDGTRPNTAVGADHSVHVVSESPLDRVAYTTKPAGGTWSGWVPIANGISPSITVSSQGVIHVVYERDGVIYHIQQPPGGLWNDETSVSIGGGPAAQNPDVATGANLAIPGPKGEIHVVWAEGGEIFARTRTASGAWGTVVNISADPPSSRDPAVAVDSAGVAYAVWTGSDNIVWQASKAYKQAFWSSPSIVCCTNGKVADYPDIAVGPNTAIGPNNTVWKAFCLRFIGLPSDCFFANGIGTHPFSKTQADSIRARVAGAILDSETDGPHALWTQTPGTSSFGGCIKQSEPEICYFDGPTDPLKGPLAVSDSPAVPSDYPAIASFDDGFVHVVWQELPGARWEIFYAESAAADSDADGMSDLYEEPRSCLSKLVDDASADPDSDGLTNLAEYQTGTDPCKNDTDQDGCADGEELGPNEAAGGQRNPLNFWDFYDVPTQPGPARDKLVDGFDLGEVVARFGSTGNSNIDPLSPPPPTGYHTAFDRGPVLGPNLWDSYPADGRIEGFDIGTIVVQFGHSCVGAP